MNSQEIIDKIKERGYWEIKLTPLAFNPELIANRQALIEIIERAQVRLRGWYYPHIGHWNREGNRRPTLGRNYIEGGSDWGEQIEFWRFTQSGQFVHLFAMDEDYIQESGWARSNPRLADFQPGDVLNTGSVIYGVSEIFAFVNGLAREGIYEGGARIEITLHGTSGRRLTIFDSAKVGLFEAYICGTPTVEWQREMSNEEMLNEYKPLALEAIHYIFESFNWLNQPGHVFEEDQRKLFERRL